MINWKRCTYGDKVRVNCVSGNVFDGIVECVDDVEDRSDLEKQEDGLSIITDDERHISFYESEIKSVSRRYDDGEIGESAGVRFIPQSQAALRQTA